MLALYEMNGLLSPRQLEVLKFASDGLTTREIALTLHLSRHTVDNYFREIYRRLNVRTRSLAISKGFKVGLLIMSDEPTAPNPTIGA